MNRGRKVGRTKTRKPRKRRVEGGVGLASKKKDVLKTTGLPCYNRLERQEGPRESSVGKGTPGRIGVFHAKKGGGSITDYWINKKLEVNRNAVRRKVLWQWKKD